MKNLTITWEQEHANNKYSLWYNALIEKARTRQYPKGSYGEMHHVIPRSFGGSNSKFNLVKLTAREHYLAHAMLWRMRFTGNHYISMSRAFLMMCHTTKSNSVVSAKAYEKLRIEFALYHSASQTGSRNSFFGKKHTPEVMAKIKATKMKTGKYNNGFRKGFVLTEAAKAKISAANSGKTWDTLFSADELLIRKQKRSEETRTRNTGQIFSAERRRKISEGAKGRIPHNKGISGVVKQTPETVAKRLATMKTRGITSTNKSSLGKKYSPETIAKRVATRKTNALAVTN